MAILEDTVTDEKGRPTIVRIEVAETSGRLYTETEETSGGHRVYERQTRGSAPVVDRAKDAFKDSLQLIQTCATQISATLHTIPPHLKPKEYEVQFSVKIDGKVGAFIAESTAGAQLQVTLKWGESEQK